MTDEAMSPLRRRMIVLGICRIEADVFLSNKRSSKPNHTPGFPYPNPFERSPASFASLLRDVRNY